MSGRKGSVLIAGSMALMLLAGGTAQAVFPLEPVITGKGAQWMPSANDEFIAYSQWTRSNGLVALAQPIGGGTKTRLNATGTRGLSGALDPGTNRVIYEQWSKRSPSNLFFFNLNTGRRSKVAGVNTRAWEGYPLISKTFITFHRDRLRKGTWYTSLFAYRRANGALRKLGTWNRDSFDIFNGSAGDRYLTYTLCSKRGCFAYLYDWTAKSRTRIPSVNRRSQYAPVVDEVNDNVYFSRSGKGCGVSVNIWRLPISLTGSAEKIVALPSGIDTGWTSSLTSNGVSGQMDLYIERWNCERETGDIFVARGVDAGPSPEE